MHRLKTLNELQRLKLNNIWGQTVRTVDLAENISHFGLKPFP